MNVQIDIEKYKELLGNYPTGVNVVTTIKNDNTPIGLTINSFASVSLNPSLILWSLDKNNYSLEIFKKAKYFAVNILASGQKSIAQLFSKKEVNRFANCSWRLSEYNLPIINDTVGYLECETYEIIEAGDHFIIIGKVIIMHNSNKEPLLYHKRTFGKIPREFYE